MFNKIGKGLKVVWDGFVKLCDIYNRILMLPFNLVVKLYHWVYD